METIKPEWFKPGGVFGEPITDPNKMRRLRYETALYDLRCIGLDLSDAEKQVLKERYDNMDNEKVFAWMKPSS